MRPDDIPRALARLASRRPIFHSEADLQHELAWELRAMLGGDVGVRLERPMGTGERLHVDIVIHHQGEPVGIELKYWPRAWVGCHDGEAFEIKNRGAQDLGRYDFWKDVSRVERLVRERHVVWGAAIAVSNDSAYWSSPKAGTMAEPFTLHEHRRAPGTMAWPRATGTTKGRTSDITVSQAHDVRWVPFGSPEAWPPFRYLALVVPRGE